MREKIALALIITGLVALATGCRQQVDRAPFKSAIQQSFAGRHVCVFPEAIKLPAEIDPSKDERVRDFNALADAGLLIRGLKEQKRPAVGSTPLNQYDLSDKGHAGWAPVPDRPGYGNFCFGHFNVTAVDKATPNDPSNPTQYTLNYSYEVEGIPEWARTPESMRAFRNVAADTSIQSATATLVKTADGGWAVTPPQSAQ
jgi:hypothetical protein